MIASPAGRPLTAGYSNFRNTYQTAPTPGIGGAVAVAVNQAIPKRCMKAQAPQTEIVVCGTICYSRAVTLWGTLS